MPITNAVQRGSCVYLYNEKGRQIASFSVGAGPQGPHDGLTGFTSTVVNIRRGDWIYSHDEQGNYLTRVHAPLPSAPRPTPSPPSMRPTPAPMSAGSSEPMRSPDHPPGASSSASSSAELTRATEASYAELKRATEEFFSGLRQASGESRPAPESFGDRAHRFGEPDAGEFGNWFGAGERREAESSFDRVATVGGDLELSLELSLTEVLEGTVREVCFSVTDPESGESQRRELSVRVPVGVRPETRLRVAGRGLPGRDGGAAGALWLRIQWTVPDGWMVEGDDLVVPIRLSAAEVAHGGVAEVAGIEGPIQFRLPSGVPEGSVLRVRGRGLPRKEATTERGDLLARVECSPSR